VAFSVTSHPPYSLYFTSAWTQRYSRSLQLVELWRELFSLNTWASTCKHVKSVSNPLSSNVQYTPHDANVTCSGCGALYRQNH